MRNVTPTFNVRNSRSPLSMDDIRRYAPSAFAVEPYHAMSAKYGYIPTSDVITGMMAAGFQPYAAAQSRTSVLDKKEHTKHMIRFRIPAQSTALTIGDIFPEIVLINSHDGTSAYKLMAGLFRLVCLNGMVVADSLLGSVSIRHSGNIIEQAAAKSFELVTHIPEVLDTVSRWKSIELTANEQGVFAESAHALRFADSEGKIDTPIQASQLLQVRRHDDNRRDLWTTFNRVQENVIKGGLRARDTATRRRVSTRAVNGIDSDVRLNKALWTLSERMAELKAN